MLDPVDASCSKVCQGSFPSSMKKRYICRDFEPATSSFGLAQHVWDLRNRALFLGNFNGREEAVTQPLMNHCSSRLSPCLLVPLKHRN